MSFPYSCKVLSTNPNGSYELKCTPMGKRQVVPDPVCTAGTYVTNADVRPKCETGVLDSSFTKFSDPVCVTNSCCPSNGEPWPVTGPNGAKMCWYGKKDTVGNCAPEECCPSAGTVVSADNPFKTYTGTATKALDAYSSRKCNTVTKCPVAGAIDTSVTPNIKYTGAIDAAGKCAFGTVVKCPAAGTIDTSVIPNARYTGVADASNTCTKTALCPVPGTWSSGGTISSSTTATEADIHTGVFNTSTNTCGIARGCPKPNTTIPGTIYKWTGYKNASGACKIFSGSG